MNYAIILAGGTGQRMKSSGMPKQFLPVYGKPIIIYTLETFQKNKDIDEIVIPCNESWIDHMKHLVEAYNITKAKNIIVGGKDRMDSIIKGVSAIKSNFVDEDIIVIHDGVRPLVQPETIEKNIKVARENGNAMTVKANIETVVVTEKEEVIFDNFMDRSKTYTLTSPQSFRALELIEILSEYENGVSNGAKMPILDVSLAYAEIGKKIYIVVENGNNLKITTPEDYYYLKSYLELQESKKILGV